MKGDILYRVELHTEDQAREALTRWAHPWIKDQLRQGNELVGEFRLLEDYVTDRQRGFLHGVVLTEIALYARVNGQRFDLKTWKEWFRKEWLGFRTVTYTDPFTGKKSRRRERISTEDLGIKKMAEYIDRMIAFAATDLHVEVSEPLPPELRPMRRRPRETVDAATGEILETA